MMHIYIKRVKYSLQKQNIFDELADEYQRISWNIIIFLINVLNSLLKINQSILKIIVKVLSNDNVSGCQIIDPD